MHHQNRYAGRDKAGSDPAKLAFCRRNGCSAVTPAARESLPAKFVLAGRLPQPAAASTASAIGRQLAKRTLSAPLSAPAVHLSLLPVDIDPGSKRTASVPSDCSRTATSIGRPSVDRTATRSCGVGLQAPAEIAATVHLHFLYRPVACNASAPPIGDPGLVAPPFCSRRPSIHSRHDRD